MGMLGEMFPGKKLGEDGDADSDGKLVRPRFDIDLDSGVVRLPPVRRAKPAPAVDEESPEQ